MMIYSVYIINCYIVPYRLLITVTSDLFMEIGLSRYNYDPDIYQSNLYESVI